LATLNARAFIKGSVPQSTLWSDASASQTSHNQHVAVIRVRHTDELSVQSTTDRPDVEMVVIAVSRSLFVAFFQV